MIAAFVAFKNLIKPVFGFFYPPGHEKTDHHKTDHKDYDIAFTTQFAKCFAVQPHFTPDNNGDKKADKSTTQQQAAIEDFVKQTSHG